MRLFTGVEALMPAAGAGAAATDPVCRVRAATSCASSRTQSNDRPEAVGSPAN